MNIPTELVIQSISKRWNFIEDCTIPEDEFLEWLE